MKDDKKLTFWKKLKISITDFEKYQDLAAENVLKTIIYIAILMAIFCLVVAGIYTYQFTATISNIKEYVDDNIETITFENNILNIVPKNGEEITKIENELVGIKVIINTQTDDEEKIKESIEEIKAGDTGILFLKDKIVIKNQIVNTPYSYDYASLAEQYNINKLDKQEFLNLLSSDIIKPQIMSFSMIMFVVLFMMYFSSVLIDILVLSVFAFVVSLVTKLRLKYSALYNISAYAMTLSIILNLLYIVINSFTGFEIKYFEVMYTTVATIYIATAILMIRSDVIKKQIELTKIIEEQDRVRAELQRREEEKKEQEEKERQKKEDEKRRKEKEKKEKDEKENLGEQPEGDNV